MVAEAWMDKMRAKVGSNLGHVLPLDHHSTTDTDTDTDTAATKKKELEPPPHPDPAVQKGNTVGILSFEVAGAMSKAVHLYKSLSSSEVSRLRTDVLKSDAVRDLVSADEAHLLQLVAAEKLEDLNRVASVVSRLGKRCSEQALVGFEHVYADLLNGRVGVGQLGFLVKDMGSTIKKMERYVSSTASLYGELEVLNELEQGARNLYLTQQQQGSLRAYEQKIQTQKHEVKHLRDVSLWNQTYEKIAALMAKAVCTTYARVRLVLGESLLSLERPPDGSRQLPGQVNSSQHRPFDGSGPAVPGPPQGRQAATMRGESPGFHCGSIPGRFFTGCLSLSSSAPWKHDGKEHLDLESGSCLSRVGMNAPFSADQREAKHGTLGKQRFYLTTGLAVMCAPPSTVGGSALAPHYANVIIIIEKLLKYPHLVGEEARDDLYQMLPTSLRMALRRALKSYVKDLAIYDAPVAHGWKRRLDKILGWLSPMAHGMIRWLTERSFERQQIVSGANVLLIQTLYFADREKTEAVICELLVGLNYICRYEHQRNALLNCTSSLDFDESVDWQWQ